MIIDSRESSVLCSNVEYFAGLARVPVERTFLEVGDYVGEHICIEAKSVNDFYYSVKEKRMFNQISNMEDNYSKTIVLIHGRASELGTHLNTFDKTIIDKMKRRLVGAMSAITLNTNTKVVWIPSTRDAAEFIVACFYNKDRKVDLSKMLPKKKRTDDVRIDILTQIKGITKEKANLLLKTYGSIAKIASSDVKSLMKVEKIGKITASSILEALNEEKEVSY